MFAGEAFHSGWAEGSVQGTISIDRLRLRFAGTGVSLEIPLICLQINPEESGSVAFSSTRQPEWVVRTPDSEILSHRILREQPHTRNQLRELENTGEWKRRLTITFGVLGVFCVLAWLVWLATGVMVRVLVARIPPQWEQQIGDKAMAELRKEETFLQDVNLLTKLDRAVSPLLKSLPASSIQYKFYLVEEPLPNAFALPGGHVIVTTGLLEMAGRPEEIAGVVAHEVAHVTQKHAFRQTISRAGPYLIFQVFFGGSKGLLPMLGGSSELLINQSFSRNFEFEADEVGWDLLVAAHIDPRGLADMLRKFQAEENKMRGVVPHIQAFSSHPATQTRIQRLDSKWSGLKNKTGFVPL